MQKFIKQLVFIFIIVFVSNTKSQSVNLQWAKQIGNSFSESEWTTCLDPTGNVYVTGSFSGTVDFDPGIGIFNVTSASISDNFILKLDPLGNFLSVLRVIAVSVRAMYIDPLGNIYTAGTFSNTTDFDPGAGTFTMSASAGGSYLLKLDASGNFVWAKKIANAGFTQPISVTADPSGNVITTGFFLASADFDPGPGSFFLNNRPR